MPVPGTLIDELRRLATVLPPSLRARGAEAADLISAVIARAEHGQPIIDAADQGPQVLADFLHEQIAADAQARNVAAPQKGSPVANVQPTPAGPAAGGVTRTELDQLKADILSSIKDLVAPTASTVTGKGEEGAAAHAAPSDPSATAGEGQELGL